MDVVLVVNDRRNVFHMFHQLKQSRKGFNANGISCIRFYQISTSEPETWNMCAEHLNDSMNEMKTMAKKKVSIRQRVCQSFAVLL